MNIFDQQPAILQPSSVNPRDSWPAWTDLVVNLGPNAEPIEPTANRDTAPTGVAGKGVAR